MTIYLRVRDIEEHSCVGCAMYTDEGGCRYREVIDSPAFAPGCMPREPDDPHHYIFIEDTDEAKARYTAARITGVVA